MRGLEATWVKVGADGPGGIHQRKVVLQTSQNPCTLSYKGHWASSGSADQCPPFPALRDPVQDLPIQEKETPQVSPSI